MNTIPNLGTVVVSFEPDRIVLTPNSEDDRRRLAEVIHPDETFPIPGQWETSILFVLRQNATTPRLSFRTQTPADAARISVTCPTDQTANFSMAWVDGKRVELLVITDIDSRPSEEQQELARVNAMTDPDLQTLAAELGVEWDDKASRKTMVEKVVASVTCLRAGVALRAADDAVIQSPPPPPAAPPAAKPKGKGKQAMLSEYLEEVKEIAVHLCDQIEGIEILEAKPGDERFARYASPILRVQKHRDAMKRLVETSINRIAGSPLAMKLMDPDAVPAAARLVTWAIKHLLKALDPKLGVVFKLRLIVQFSSIEHLWIEDGQAEQPDLLVP